MEESGPAWSEPVDRSSLEIAGADRSGSGSPRSAAKLGGDLTPHDALA